MCCGVLAVDEVILRAHHLEEVLIHVVVVGVLGNAVEKWCTAPRRVDTYKSTTGIQWRAGNA